MLDRQSKRADWSIKKEVTTTPIKREKVKEVPHMGNPERIASEAKITIRLDLQDEMYTTQREDVEDIIDVDKLYARKEPIVKPKRAARPRRACKKNRLV